MLANNDEKKLLLKGTCIFWLIAKWITRKVLTSNRLMPTAASFDFLDYAPNIIHDTFSLMSVMSLVVFLLTKNNRIVLLALLSIEVFLCFLDLSRLQPWEYQYLFIVFVCLVNYKTPKYVLPAVTFILAGTYFYSGLAKLNEGFLQGTWESMILKHFLKINPNVIAVDWVHYSGYLLGTMEALAGIGLLFTKTRKNVSLFLICMHLFILLLLGPWGLRYNKSVWPWNAAMIMYLCIIILKYNKKTLPLLVINNGWNRAVILCWGILPSLNFIGYWDNYLSSSVYSGRLPRMTICITDTNTSKTLRRFYMKADSLNICNGQASIDLQQWAISEMTVPVYPQKRVYRKIQKKLQKQYPEAGLRFVYFINTTDKKGNIDN